MKLNKGKSKVLNLRRNNLQDLYTMGANRLESSFAKRSLENNKLIARQQHNVTAKKAKIILAALRRVLSVAKKGDASSLDSADEATPGVPRKSVVCRPREVILPLFTAPVRPHESPKTISATKSLH